MALFLRNLVRKATQLPLLQNKCGLQEISQRNYDPKVLDHYNKPRNVGKFDANDPSVGTGLVGAPACGDVMRLQIKVDENGNIIESCFKTFGCGSAIASSSYATETVIGKSIDEASKLTNKDIAKELKLPPVKLHCSMLAEDAIKAAIKDYQHKKALKQQLTFATTTSTTSSATSTQTTSTASP